MNLGIITTIVPKVNGNVKLLNLSSSGETLLQEYLFTERRTDVYIVAAALNLLSHDERQL